MIESSAVFAAIGAELIRFAVDAETGELTERSRLTLPAMIQEGVRHPELSILYLACTDHEHDRHSIVPVVIDDASMTTGGVQPLPARAVQLSLSGAGRTLVATHTKHPSLSVFGLDASGAIGAASDDHDVDFAAYLHDMQFSPDDARAVIVGRGHTGRTGTPYRAGRIQLATHDDGRLREIDSIELSPDQLPAGFNPRNVAFHSSEPLLYVTLEAQNLLLTFGFADDRLRLLPERTQQLLDHPESARARQLAGVVAMHPAGTALYAVTRADGPIVDNDRWRTPEHLPIFEGGENTISVFSVADGGTLTLRQRIDTGGISARCILIAAGGRLLIAANGKPIMRATDEAEPALVPSSLAVFAVSESGALSLLTIRPFDVGRETLWWVG